MKKNSLLLAAVALAVTASFAGATEQRQSGAFPTDVQPQYNGTASVGYGFEYQKNRSELLNSGTLTKYTNTINRHTVDLSASYGLGYGLQIGVDQSFIVGGNVTTRYPSASDYTIDYSGAKNTVFNVRWSPTQAFGMTDSPLQAAVSYKIKPRGIADTHASDDFTVNAVNATVSYNLVNYALRPYIGYEFVQYGKGGAQIDDDRMGTALGHNNTGIVGAEIEVFKGLNARAQYAFTQTASVQSYTKAFNTHTVRAEVEYMVPGMPIYVRPFGEMDFVGKRDYSGQAAGDSYVVKSDRYYRAGLKLGVLF